MAGGNGTGRIGVPVFVPVFVIGCWSERYTAQSLCGLKGKGECDGLEWSVTCVVVRQSTSVDATG